MKTFGINKIVDKNFKYYLNFTNGTFLILTILCFSIFSFYYNITRLVFSEDKINLYKENLQDIAFYFWNFDRELAENIIKLDWIIKDHIKQENILITKEQEIKTIREYAKNKKMYLYKLGFSNYEWLINLIWKLQKHQDEILELLGKKQEFNYLVILQNTNEKRPNGWFFGSFAFVSFSGWHINELEIVDAYYPDFIAHNTYLEAPERSSAFLPDKKIWFIAANKFGFTNIDGKNIKTLYEKMFNETFVMRKVQKTMTPDLYKKLLHKNIKWVIFIRTDLFEEILPGFREKVRERQFVNASIDLIRNNEDWNKKEIYIKELTDYFNNNKFQIGKNIIQNFDKVINKNQIQIYLSNISTGLNLLLTENNLSNTFSPNKIYARDTNNSFNKVDNFITKNIQIQDTNKKIIIETQNDILDITELVSWEYFMNIHYSLNVPFHYEQFIHELETKYQILLNPREKWILWLEPADHFEDIEPKFRESKSTIYFPKNFKILSNAWDTIEYKNFETPFSNWVFYKIKILENNITKSITIKFLIQAKWEFQ